MNRIKDYDKLRKIISNFKINGELVEIDTINNGIINTTYVFTFTDKGTETKYLLQKINTKIFNQPYRLMKNIENVTTFIRSTDPKCKPCLSVIETKDGASLWVEEDDFSQKEFYRVYNYIDDTVTYNKSVNKDVVYNTGKAFGHFQSVLNNYPMQLLEETIPNFHNTKSRYQDFINSYRSNAVDRNSTALDEIAMIMSRQEYCSLITDLLDNKTIPYRVTHNDTKVNNVLMSSKTGEYLTVIDLDTVMPGSGLYDYGDGVRSTCSTALEDEKDLSKVSIDMELFRVYTDGFLSEMAPYLVPEEVSNMVNSIKVITLELAMRFLGDYLNGDVYFKTEYKEHNLDRARNQLKLLEDIEMKEQKMNRYVQESYEKNKGKVKIKK